MCFRARRRRAREGKNISGHNEGLSSDDEENQSEITKYNQERGGDLYSHFVQSLLDSVLLSRVHV